LGVGKSTIAERLARRRGWSVVSIDRILEEPDGWYSGRLAEFLRANGRAEALARPLLKRGVPVIFDGNFYWKTQIEDLLRRIDLPHRVFSLTAPLALCVARDGQRPQPHGAEAARRVYARSTKFSYGIPIDARRAPLDVVRQIERHLTGISDRATGKVARGTAGAGL
jgi:predicted kinase